MLQEYKKIKFEILCKKEGFYCIKFFGKFLLSVDSENYREIVDPITEFTIKYSLPKYKRIYHSKYYRVISTQSAKEGREKIQDIFLLDKNNLVEYLSDKKEIEKTNNFCRFLENLIPTRSYYPQKEFG